MTTAIIGLGNIGAQVATLLSAGGEAIVVADRTDAKAAELAKTLSVEWSSVEGAIRKADIVIFSVYFDAIKALIEQYREILKNKIVVDPSNPIAPDGQGGFKKIIPQDQSSGALLAALLPQETKLVKAFGTLGAESLKKSANRVPERAALFYASDDGAAGNRVGQLITAAGYAPVSIGDIDQSIRIEVGGDLHEFGPLGKLVSVQEASALV